MAEQSSGKARTSSRALRAQTALRTPCANVRWRPDAGHVADVGVADDLDRKAGCLMHTSTSTRCTRAQVRRKTARRHAAELEPHNHARLGQPRHVNPPPDVEHEEADIEIVRGELRPRVVLTPGAEAFHDVPERFAGSREPVFATATSRQGPALHDTRVLELAETMRQLRARDQRHARRIWLSGRSRRELAAGSAASTARRRSRGDGDRAELAVALMASL